MSIRLTGQLLSPTDGSPAANGQIRFISLQGTGKVPKGAIAIEAADSNGDYDFTLEFGRFSVEIRQADKFVKQGAVSVNADTPTPLEIGGLLEYTEPLTPGQITYVEQLTAQAEAAAQAANVSQSAANSSAMAASNSAAEAKSEADRASEITGLDTVEEAIDLTLSKTLGVMTETEAMAQADAYEQMFAASGMVHNGKDYRGAANVTNVNEGISVYPTSHSTWYNQIMIGSPDDANDRGTSKTPYAVTHIAGAIINLMGVPRNDGWVGDGTHMFMELPPAEDGTRIYDSTGDARGSGEATLDLRYDPDPKYGAAPTGTEAEILVEAVGRAFEGEVKNGDFRNGIDVWGLANGAQGEINGNVISLTRGIDDADAYLTTAFSVEAGKDYTLEFYGDFTQAGYLEDPNSIEVRVSSSTSILRAYDELFGESKVGRASFTFTATETFSSFVRFRINTNTSIVKIGSVSIRAATEEVVTHRVDLATWESYDEELTGRTEVFECIQSLSTTFGDTDVSTVLSERPLSYFQQYDGQFADPDVQNDRYRCVVWDDLTDEQKRKVAAYMGNKLYIGENGYLVNRRLRARTFRGLGNGDWENIDCTVNNALLRFDYESRVRPQGIKDVAPKSSSSSNVGYAGENGQYPSTIKQTGLYAPYNSDASSNVAYKGRCFMYVVASVPRANQGAYNPSLNPWGCNYYRSATGYGVSWYGEAAAWVDKETEKSCFDPRMIGSTAGDTTPLLPSPVGSRGSIASGYSSHPDGIFYDGITAGGLNGVIDWRLPAVANDTPEEQAKVQGKVENKTFRGLEKLVWTKIHKSAAAMTFVSNSPNNSYYYASGNMFPELLTQVNVNYSPKTLYVVDSAGTVHAKATHIQRNATHSYIWFDGTVSGLVTGDVYLAWTDELNLSVSGEFNTSMVIAPPETILQVDAVKNGWLGTWGGLLLQGSVPYELTRKSLGNLNSFLWSNTLGDTWLTTQVTVDQVKNETPSINIGTSAIAIANYTAYAKVTEPCENKPVYNGKAGLMPVVELSRYATHHGSLFAESLIGKILTNNANSLSKGNLYLTGHSMNESGVLRDSSLGGLYQDITHVPIDLAAPANNSPAVKALPYQIAENEQCFIGYQANEMTWDSAPPVWTISSSDLSLDTVTGRIYRVVKGSGSAVMDGGYWHCLIGSTQNWDSSNWSIDSDGDVVNVGSNTKYLTRINPQGWGDDDKIKVTADGSDTFIDRNGNTNLSVSHKTTMPTGWTKNRARVGEQVAGVDL